jgi:hypothetical protein
MDIQEGRVEWEGWRGRPESCAMTRLLDLSLPASQKGRCATSECYKWSSLY